jgi:superfamily II DNA/RNA helicase
VDMKIDEKALNSYPQIIVATPGRLCDHLERGNIWLDYVEVVVLDESDRMLDMGFSEQLKRILDDTPSTRQTLLLSATFSKSVEVLARRILKTPHRLQIGKAHSPAKTVDQQFLFMDDASKLRVLKKLIREEPGKIFIFTRSKERATNLWRSLQRHGFNDVTHLHSNLRQMDREQALEDFKSGKYRVIIATDVIGRGIHVDDVALVINCDLPRDAEDYIHRIGRTGRADTKGKAITFVTPQDRLNLKKIERLLGHPIRGEKV